MKILFLTANYSKQGAVAKYAVELSTRFAREHEVHVLCSAQDHSVDGVVVHRIRIPWWPHWAHVGLNALKNTYYGRKLKEKYGIDVVHSQGAESLYQDVLKAPSCHLAAVEQFKRERGPVYSALKALEPASNIVLPIERYNYTRGNFRKAIVMSRGTYREIQGHYGVPDEKLKLIPNGVNIEEYTPDNRRLFREDTRRRHGLTEDDIILLFVGWEFKRKGLMHVIDALPKLPEDVKVLAVGGDDRRAYEKRALDLGVAGRVVFAGASRDVRRYYAAADMFVFPTAYEGFSMATLEAAATGLPVIATRVNGTEDLIREGENGYFVARDGADIAEKVNVIVDGGMLPRMSAKARESAIPHSWDIVANETMKLYREILE